MLEIAPFHALRFNLAKIGGYDNVITPPFDVISPAQRAELGARSPHNMVHVILPQAEGHQDPYHAAAERLQQWMDEEAVVTDSEPGYYILDQRFIDDRGAPRSRRAFYAIVKIPEPGQRLILDHEKTFAHKIQDRLALTRATRTQFGGIFVLYEDSGKELAPFLDQCTAWPPLVAARTIDDVEQRLWRVAPDPKIAEFFRGRHLYIADGHHRFATAAAYRDEMRARSGSLPSGEHKPYEYVMMGFVALDDPGLAVYAAHRLVDLPERFNLAEFRSKLEGCFTVREARNGILGDLQAAPKGSLALVFASGEKLLLRAKPIDRAVFLGTDHGPAWRDLDVALLHRGVLENLMGMPASAEYAYEPDAEEAIAACARGEKDLACLLKPATAEQIRACAEAGEFMPQKATYLFPKLPTGAVLYHH